MKKNGFTLIELMIVLVIIGVLSAIAIPGYTTSVQKSRRTDGQSALSEFAARMERFYSANNTYVGVGQPSDVGLSNLSQQGYYQLSVGSVTASTYTLSAAPVAGSAQAGDPCGTLTLNQAGQKGPASPANCW